MVISIIIIVLLVVVLLAMAIFAFFYNVNTIGMTCFGASLVLGITLIGLIKEYKNGSAYDEKSTIVKVMNNDSSLEIDTIAFDKNGKIREVRIKEKR